MSYWKKVWPQGDTDDSTNDDKVIDFFLAPPKGPDEPKKETYPWTYDEDVISTEASIKDGEKLTGGKLSDNGAKERSMDMIDSYDNNRRVWERNMPYGNQWGVSSFNNENGRTDTPAAIISPPAGNTFATYDKPWVR